MTMEVSSLLSQVMLDMSGSWVRELNSEKTEPSGCPYISTSQAKGTPSASGHLIPGEHLR